MKTTGMFTAAQAVNLSDTEYAHYLECGCVPMDAQRIKTALGRLHDTVSEQQSELEHENRGLTEELEEAREEAKELSGQLQTLRGLWRGVSSAVRGFAQELLGNDTAIKLDLEEPPSARR